jgi:hypothetical protein
VLLNALGELILACGDATKQKQHEGTPGNTRMESLRHTNDAFGDRENTAAGFRTIPSQIAYSPAISSAKSE